MKCPFCGDQESKVVDSRHSEDGTSIRRRRECLECQKRFTTFEVVESVQTIAEKLGITRSSVAVHISNLIKKGYIAGKGYVLRSGSYAVVVGGVNVDIGGRSFAPLVAADSRLGWEPTMEYNGGIRNVTWKIRQTRQVIEHEIPAIIAHVEKYLNR